VEGDEKGKGKKKDFTGGGRLIHSDLTGRVRDRAMRGERGSLFTEEGVCCTDVKKVWQGDQPPRALSLEGRGLAREEEEKPCLISN